MVIIAFLLVMASFSVTREHDYNSVVGYTPQGMQIFHSMGLLWGSVITIAVAAAAGTLHVLGMVATLLQWAETPRRPALFPRKDRKRQ